jgi:hypothetical protein
MTSLCLRLVTQYIKERQTLMPRQSHSENEELAIQLRSLVSNDVLEHPAARATAWLVADHGLAILTPDERFIYEWHIKPYLHGTFSDEDPECISV